MIIIEIDDNKTLRELQQSFSQHYPFLQLAFYDEAHDWNEKSHGDHLLPADTTIGAIRKTHNPGALKIHPWQKTGTIEQHFRKRFGLNVQIFRHQGKEWVQTIGTDYLTIEEQNTIGRNASFGVLETTN